MSRVSAIPVIVGSAWLALEVIRNIAKECKSLLRRPKVGVVEYLHVHVVSFETSIHGELGVA